MKLAPLQLVDYFVHSIRVEALDTYDPDKGQELDLKALHVQEKCTPIGESEEDHRYAIELEIKQDAVDGKNIPYSYEVKLVGFLDAHPDYPADKVKTAVETNGPTMLFGAAREIIRAATGRGPYGPLLIPSTTFLTSPLKKTKKTAKKAVAKKAAKKATRKRAQ